MLCYTFSIFGFANYIILINDSFEYSLMVQWYCAINFYVIIRQ